jgi:hypothetical protein
MPTDAQLRCLYPIGYQLTYMLFQPIHLICIDGRTQNLYILAGQNEEIEARNYSKWGGAVMSQVDYTAMSYRKTGFKAPSFQDGFSRLEYLRSISNVNDRPGVQG